MLFVQKPGCRRNNQRGLVLVHGQRFSDLFGCWIWQSEDSQANQQPQQHCARCQVVLQHTPVCFFVARFYVRFRLSELLSHACRA